MRVFKYVMLCFSQFINSTCFGDEEEKFLWRNDFLLAVASVGSGGFDDWCVPFCFSFSIKFFNDFKRKKSKRVHTQHKMWFVINMEAAPFCNVLCKLQQQQLLLLPRLFISRNFFWDFYIFYELYQIVWGFTFHISLDLLIIFIECFEYQF